MPFGMGGHRGISPVSSRWPSGTEILYLPHPELQKGNSDLIHFSRYARRIQKGRSDRKPRGKGKPYITFHLGVCQARKAPLGLSVFRLSTNLLKAPKSSLEMIWENNVIFVIAERVFLCCNTKVTLRNRIPFSSFKV